MSDCWHIDLYSSIESVYESSICSEVSVYSELRNYDEAYTFPLLF